MELETEAKMRKILCFTAMLAMIFALAACNGEAGTNVLQETPETPASAETQPPAEASAAPVFYGTWTVQKAVGSAQISTGVEESMIGKKATYSTEKAIFDGEEVLNPVYEEQTVTNEQFVADYRSQLRAIGIDADSATIVKIKDWTAPGSLLLVKDDQTLITLWDGTFYALKKES